jgi:hypothetical protein
LGAGALSNVAGSTFVNSTSKMSKDPGGMLGGEFRS